MHRTIVAACVLALSLAMAQSDDHVATCSPSCCQDQVQDQDPNSVTAIIDRLDAKARSLEAYECKLDYIFKQPLLESQTRRTGTLRYARFGDRSFLRVDLNTLQYDDEPEQKHNEQFLFDGIWGTYIDHQSQSVQRQQVAEPNAPLDAFALLSRRVPVLGFSKSDDLRKEFDIERLPETQPNPAPVYTLRMKVKPDSVYHADYTTIDFQIDKKLSLPSRIVAVTTEQEDIHEIKLTDPRINHPIPREVFDIDIPAGFSIETVPLERAGRPK
jgi:outer membrane lipoprotein-sorting protein